MVTKTQALKTAALAGTLVVSAAGASLAALGDSTSDACGGCGGPSNAGGTGGNSPATVVCSRKTQADQSVLVSGKFSGGNKYSFTLTTETYTVPATTDRFGNPATRKFSTRISGDEAIAKRIGDAGRNAGQAILVTTVMDQCLPAGALTGLTQQPPAAPITTPAPRRNVEQPSRVVTPPAPTDYELAFAVCGGEQTAMNVSQSANIRLGHVAQAAFKSTPSGFNVDRRVRMENGFDFTNEEAIAGFETLLTDCEYAAVVKLHDGSLRNDQPYEISNPAQVCYMPGNQGWTDGYREWALDTTGDVACPTQLPVEEPCDCNDGTAVTESGLLGGKNGIFAMAVIGAVGALGAGITALGRRRKDIAGPKAPTA